MNKEIMHSRAAKVTAAGFTAALAANLDATDLSAGIVTLNFTPGEVPFTPISTLVNVDIKTSNGSTVGSFDQWNDSLGKSMQFNNNGMSSWQLKNAGDVISDANFTGGKTDFLFSTQAIGTQYVAFRAKAGFGGGVGWFAFYMGDAPNSAVNYTGGSQFSTDQSLTVGSGYNTPGEVNTTGGGDGVVPEPGHVGLSLLALGAVGIRRRRSMRRQAV